MMKSENFTIVIDPSGIPPRHIAGLVTALGDILRCQPIVTAVPSEDGVYTEIVMPGEHDLKYFSDLTRIISEINFWAGGENVVEFSFYGKKP